MAEMLLRSTLGTGRGGDGGLAAAERALALNPDLAEAHAVKARILSEEKRNDEASREIETALQLDPESHQVNKSAAILRFRQQRLEESIRHLEKAVALEEGDFGSSGMLITCYTALGNREAIDGLPKSRGSAQKRFWRTILITARRWATAVLRLRCWVSESEQKIGWGAPC